MSDTRLIERWLPIAELGEESTRERRSMTALPPTYYLHVWWARRPLVASRAAVLASLLPADADRKRFLQVLGIHGDPVASRRRIDEARRTGERFKGKAYSYPRAFTHAPVADDIAWLKKTVDREGRDVVTLDPTAGGGSIPFEAIRIGCSSVANDLNPVAALLLRATVSWPSVHGQEVQKAFRLLAERLVAIREERLIRLFPKELIEGAVTTNWLWTRTVTCPYCEGLVPLSPNWRLAPGGTGVRVFPQCASGPGSAGRVCSFEIVDSAEAQSGGTVARGAGTCPFPDCGRVIAGEAIKQQAQEGRMGEELYAVVYKEQVPVQTKTGKTRWKRVRRFRAPRPEDDNGGEIAARLAEKMPEWEALDIVPSEGIPEGNKTTEPRRYGMQLWRDLFSPRQLLCHGTGVEVFREMLDADRAAAELTDVRRAAYGYLALSLDKWLNYNSRMSVWMPTREVVANTFNRHDFAFCWSHAEMSPLIAGLGFDWAIRQTAKCVRELVSLVRPPSGAPANGLFAEPADAPPPPPTITCKPAHDLDHIADASVDVVVMDPPYYDNVMYAELSDFFYVWLKRTAGHVFPELFRQRLTDKENEAVANPARFAGQKGAKARAGRDYQERMAAIFAECRRVLKRDGVMTLMFTHKATGAWDALTTGLIKAGFVITASWPINTEAQGSLHIKDKAAANSTIFLVCRPRTIQSTADLAAPMMASEPIANFEGSPIVGEQSADLFWEDIEPTVAHAVRRRVSEFQEAGIAGVDLYLASFGPALEEFSRRWPLRRGRPRVEPARLRGTRKQDLFGEARDPYVAVPEDALDVARREVKRWRLQQLTEMEAGEDLDPTTAFFVLAWDAFKAPAFAYDEALRLARAAGVDLDGQIVGHLGEKRGSDLHLWDSSRRAAAGALGPPDGSRGMVDALHYAANRVRRRTLDEAMELLRTIRLDAEPRFLLALKAVLEVLPLPGGVTGAALSGAAAGFGSDFEALNRLRRFGFRDRAKEPRQLSVWEQTAS